MKTTFDLPPDLVREVKLRAAHEGRKFKDVAAELLRRGLGRPEPVEPAKPRIEIQANGLPVIRCGKDAPASRMTTEELLALEQETLVRVLPEPPELETLWHRLAAIPTAAPKVWMDAYLAAFAIRHDVEFVTLDKDFKNFLKDELQLKLLTPG